MEALATREIALRRLEKRFRTPAGTVHAVRGIDLTIEAHDEFLGATFSGVSWGSLIAFVVIFLLFSRVWRLRPRRSA